MNKKEISFSNLLIAAIITTTLSLSIPTVLWVGNFISSDTAKLIAIVLFIFFSTINGFNILHQGGKK